MIKREDAKVGAKGGAGRIAGIQKPEFRIQKDGGRMIKREGAETRSSEKGGGASEEGGRRWRVQWTVVGWPRARNPFRIPLRGNRAFDLKTIGHKERRERIDRSSESRSLRFCHAAIANLTD